ncbi:hypothetical protein SAMN05444487_11837 [Marininema mesophilum]|uniref:Uncharacterized protein n=1 Tax=Marininema mesophilum TaxID=1048340 RepID=A0A1H3BUE0_9BACL|nr:hypothetical protein [Marininema mesophilum]SDX45513.1 hypothetical protein SAMN05444487_11837 [Marininema mesophilum]
MTDQEKQDELERFDDWLFYMDDVLEEFLEKKAPKSINLDYTPESLLQFEKWLLMKYSKPEDLMQESERFWLDGAARYVGEVYRKNLNGKWTIFLDDKDYGYYGRPMVHFFKKTDPVSPHSDVIAATDRRRGDFIFELFVNTKLMMEE